MHTSNIIFLAVFALVLVAVVYKYGKKEKFHVQNNAPLGYLPGTENVPINDAYGNSVISGSYFRGGEDFAGMVTSPVVPEQKKDTVYGELLNPSDMMPSSTMSENGAGSRYTSDGGIPNHGGKPIFVNLSKHPLNSLDVFWNHGHGEGVTPINSVHRFTSPINANLGIMAAYGSGSESGARLDKENKVYDLVRV